MKANKSIYCGNESRKLRNLVSYSKQKLGLNTLFVTCLNCNNKEILEKQIKNNLDLFINTDLNHKSIRLRLVSRPKNKLISNSEQLFNTKSLLSIFFSVILSQSPSGNISTISQISPGNIDENINFNVHTIKIF